MPKQKLKPFDYEIVKIMQEKMGVKFVDSKGEPVKPDDDIIYKGGENDKH